MTNPRAKIEKILWKAYDPKQAPNMEEVVDEIMAVIEPPLKTGLMGKIVEKEDGVYLEPSSSMEERLREKIAKEIDFMCDHWVNGDDKAPYKFGGWREEIIDALVNLLSQEKSLLLEEVGKLKKDLTPLYEEDGPAKRHRERYYNFAIDDVLSLLNNKEDK